MHRQPIPGAEVAAAALEVVDVGQELALAAVVALVADLGGGGARRVGRGAGVPNSPWWRRWSPIAAVAMLVADLAGLTSLTGGAAGVMLTAVYRPT